MLERDTTTGLSDRRYDRSGDGGPGLPVSGAPAGRGPVGSSPDQRWRDATARGPDASVHETGTTVVGVTATGGVVMAADQRTSLGGRFTTNKNVRKVSRVHPTAALAISGSVGPAQAAVETIRAEASLYEARRGEGMSMTALSQTAGQVLRGLPVAPILGGVDDEGPAVFELDGSGSVLADEYAAGGSGLGVAYGVLEGRFEPSLSVGEAVEAATDAVVAASERDTASGDGVHVATITEEGVTIEDAGAGETAVDGHGGATAGEEE